MNALMPVDEAQAALLALAHPLPAIKRPLNEAQNGYLAQPLIALRTQPAHPISAMDGFAIRFADLPGPWRLRGSITAGDAPGAIIGAGETRRIFTGAPLPSGADTVLVQEDAHSADEIVALTGDGPAQCGQHVRPAGGDFAAGHELAPAGTRVTAGLIALAAMGGHADLAIGQAARVAILVTGDELAAPGMPLAPGQIPESNGAMLSALLTRVPAQLTGIHHVRDSRAATSAALAELCASHDVVVTVGGASVGDHDHVHAALQDIGAPPLFWKVAMRPGKPLMAARLGEAIVLGLPGNPVSAFVTAHLFLLPLLRHLAGAAHPLPTVRFAPLVVDLPCGGSRRDYLRAILTPAGLTLCSSQDSGFVAALASADALLIREIGAPPSPAGTLTPYIAI